MSNARFNPAWWLPGPHPQTIWASKIRRRPAVELIRERLELPDGDFVDLDWTTGSTGAIVVVLHGLEGSSESTYASGILQALHHCGWRAVLMHFRGCSGSLNRLPRSYHSGDTNDFAYLFDILRQREPDTPIAAVGYSLGGNALLKYLGETGKQAIPCAAAAVSVPFDLNNAALRLQKGLSRTYQVVLLRSLRNKVREKFRGKQTDLPINSLDNLTNFRRFDNFITAPLHGFTDVDDYYQKSSCARYLAGVHTPTLILHARDDPFMDSTAIPDRSLLSSSVTLEVSDSGGHVGFIGGSFPGRASYWLEERIPAFLKHKLRDQADLLRP